MRKMVEVHKGDNMSIFEELEPRSFGLIYMDPPFNTNKRRVDRLGSYDDNFNDYLGFIVPRLVACYDLLTSNGSLFLHLDHRESHYCKVELDKIFGRDSFMNEIIWAYDYGGRSKRKWSAKHDTILWYAKDPKNYTFNFEEMDRIPYMAPGLVGPEKAKKGKTPTDVWWHTIVPTQGKERTGYPTQKPRGIIDRIVKVHSNQGDRLLDPFAGSGTLGESAVLLDREVVLIDENEEAIQVISKRLSGLETKQPREEEV